MALTKTQICLRLNGIGGSDAGAICGVNKWRTPVDVYLEKIGAVESEDLSENQRVHFGNVLEEVVAAEYSRRTGAKVRRVNATLKSADYPWMLANIDRHVVGGKVLECKTADAWTTGMWGASYSDEVPDSYLLQCMHYMIVRKVKHSDLAVLIGGNDFRIYNIGYDQGIADILIQREYDFWHNNVLARIAPAPINTSDCMMLWPVDNGRSIEADDRIIALIESRKELKKSIKGNEAALAAVELELKAFLGESSDIITVDGKKALSWKLQESTRVDTTRLKSDAPDVFQQFAKTTSTRVMR